MHCHLKDYLVLPGLTASKPMARGSPILLVALMIIVTGCTAKQDAAVIPSVPVDDISTQSVSGSTGTVGGSVTNSAPTVESFTQSGTTGENRGAFVVVFSGAVKDKNTEAQIANISVTGLGPSTLSSNHVVTAADRSATSEPASFGADGFKVWTATANDGVLQFKYQQAFPAFTPAGLYSFTARVSDTPGLAGASSALTVTLTAFSDITISPTPVGANGASLPGANWGEWAAEAGATNVAASNYIKLVNTGDIANTRVVIDFAESFVGSTDANFSVPVANNLQFAWFEDTTPGTTAPSEGTFTFQAANADGTATVQFSGRNNVIYVTYRMAALPEILPVQGYSIAFTVTEL